MFKTDHTDHTNQSETTEQLDSPSTFARFSNITPQCVRNWCRDGLIPLTVSVPPVRVYSPPSRLRDAQRNL
jgi:hypothetical protein